MKTVSVRKVDISRSWWVMDAADVVLGRLASDAAKLLRGKHKPAFSFNLDSGDNVVVVNAAKVKLTGNKLSDKMYYRHSGYPGGLRAIPYEKLMATRPEMVVEKAIKGMLPKGRLGRQMIRKLNVYAGPTHPHEAQRPESYEHKL